MRPAKSFSAYSWYLRLNFSPLNTVSVLWKGLCLYLKCFEVQFPAVFAWFWDLRLVWWQTDESVTNWVCFGSTRLTFTLNCFEMSSQSFDDIAIWLWIIRSAVIILLLCCMSNTLSLLKYLLYRFTGIILYYSVNVLVVGFYKLSSSCIYCVILLLYLNTPFVLPGSVVLLQDVQMAVANQGWSFIKFNRVFMLYDYVQQPVCFELSGCACSVFHHELIRTNLFHNLLCSVSRFLCVFFVFFSPVSFLLYLFLIFG